MQAARAVENPCRCRKPLPINVDGAIEPSRDLEDSAAFNGFS